MKTYILYHGGGCQDGWASAFVAWKIFGDGAEYLPVQYQEPFPDLLPGSNVYILDFSYPREILREWDGKLVVLDHHKTAQQALEGEHYATFDMNRSGCVLTWEYFFPRESTPDLLKYVQDRDLWQWRLTHSEEVNAALSIQDRTFPHWDALLTYPICDFVQAGKIVLAVYRKQVQSLVTKAHIRHVGGYEVPTVNSPLLQSEIGAALCEVYPTYPFAAIYFDKDEVTRIWSLRSRPDFDVSMVAKSLGGGGHPQAAGFTQTKENKNVLRESNQEAGD